jgi:hypothetical protein
VAAAATAERASAAVASAYRKTTFAGDAGSTDSPAIAVAVGAECTKNLRAIVEIAV